VKKIRIEIDLHTINFGRLLMNFYIHIIDEFYQSLDKMYWQAFY